MKNTVIRSLAMVIILLGVDESWEQDFNPPYPRTMLFHLTDNWNFSQGSSHIQMSKYNLIIMWNNAEKAREIKKLNPNAIILATYDDLAQDPANSPFSEIQFVRASNGRIAESPWPARREYWLDMTEYCPQINGKKANQLLAERLVSQTDLSVFDGISLDTFWNSVSWWNVDYDLDRNGVNDHQEHDNSWIDNTWRDGMKVLLNNMKGAMPAEKLLFVNAGGNMDLAMDILNGHLIEYFHQLVWTWDVWKTDYDKWMQGAQRPLIYGVNGHARYDTKYGPSGDRAKDYFRLMRYGLTSTLMGDGYFGFDVYPGSEHNNIYWYDEFDLKLGYPTNDAVKLPSGCWVRFFDRGAVIVNPSGKSVTVTDGDLRDLPGYAGPYYRFRGGQDPEHNNGQPFISVELFGAPEGSSGSGREVGDGIILMREPTTCISDIIVDNKNNTTSPGSYPAYFEGTWHNDQVSYWQGSIQDNNPYWAALVWNTGDYVGYAVAAPGRGESQAIYTPTIGVAGYYEVFEWHPFHGSTPNDFQEATDVPYIIYHRDGNTSGTINQSKNYGQWNSLGIFYFEKGTTGKVVISNDANGFVLADAFKFVYEASAGNDQRDTAAPAPPSGVKVQRP